MSETVSTNEETNKFKKIRLPFDKIKLRNETISNSELKGMIVCILIFVLTLIMPVGCYFAVTKQAAKSSVAIKSEYVHDKQLSLTLTGNNIIFENCFSYTTEKGIEYAVYYSEEDSSVTFKYYNTATNIYIPTIDAGTYHFLISPAQEN